MNRKTTLIALLVAGLLGIAGMFVFLPAKEVGAGPQLVGHMQNFLLAPSIRSRPAIVWMDGKGKKVSLADFAGTVVLFNYYASWCAPCLRELPGINRLQARLGGDDFTVVALNIDRSGTVAALRMQRRLKLDKLALYVDPLVATGKILGLRAMPTTYLFDRQGREVGKLEGGAEWDSPEAVALIEYFIERPQSADNLAKK